MKNTGNIGLKDVKVQAGIDDSSVLFDAHLCDSNGKILDGAVPLEFGDLGPNISSSRLQYWWTVRAAFDGVENVGDNVTPVSLRLYPTFTADFKQSGQAFTSVSNLAKS